MNEIEALYEKILKDFERRVGSHPQIQAFLSALKDGTATSEQASLYCGYLGDCAAESLDKYFEEKYLPEGKLTWAVLEGTVDPLIREVYRRAMDAAVTVDKKELEAIGFHFNPVVPPYPVERVHALMESLIRRYDDPQEHI